MSKEVNRSIDFFFRGQMETILSLLSQNLLPQLLILTPELIEELLLLLSARKAMDEAILSIIEMISLAARTGVRSTGL